MSAALVVLQPRRPAKPPFGSPCNRCGECCRATPCLIANAILGQYIGRCSALVEHAEDGSTGCDIALHPENYMDVVRLRQNYARNGPMNRRDLAPDASPSEIILDALGSGSCDMVQRSGGGRDRDIPYEADLDAIKAEREALWRPR